MSSTAAQFNERFVAGARRFSQGAGLFVMVVGALVLVGWMFDIYGLKSVYAGITMKANTALALLLAGISLWALTQSEDLKTIRLIGKVCAASIALIGVLTLSQHILGWNLGIDQLLFVEPSGAVATTSPGRMGPPASTCFTLSGIALLLLYAGRHFITTQVFSIIVTLWALLGAIGYAYGAEDLYEIAHYTGIALHTAVTLLMLGLGLLAARIDKGWTAVLSSAHAGGIMGRRLIAAAIVVPLLLGWLRLVAQRTGYVDLGFGIALLVLALIVTFTAIIWRSAAKLNQVVHQHRAAESAARESEAKFSLIYDKAAFPIVITRLSDGVIVDFNQAFGTLFGYTREEAIGRTGTQLGMVVEAAKRAKGYEELQHHDSISDREMPVRTKSGELRVLSHNASVINLEGEEYILATLYDINDRKKAEQALRESEERFRAAVESAPNAILIVDTNGYITLVNSQAEQLFGYDRAELSGAQIETLVPDRFRHAHAGHRAVFMADPQARSMGAGRDLFCLRKDGTEVPVEIGLNPLTTSEGDFVLVSIIDITERKQAEHEREQLLVRERSMRAEAEQAGRLKDEFLATVSHELRTPLTAILGWASMLRESNLDETMSARGLEAIERNGMVQAQLIEDLLDVSRITSGKFHLDIGPVDLISVINAAADSVRPAADAKGIELHMTINQNARHVQGDPSRLQQVIWNLLSNAVKFTPRDGRIEIRLDRSDSQAEISVTDTGEGISAEFLPYVFDRFRQADGTKTRKHGGLGLGLAIARHFVEMHGGSIAVSSEGEGTGATFTTYIPLAITRPTEVPISASPSELSDSQSRPSAEQTSLHGLRILAVDDVQDTRDMLRALLRHYGADVMTAASAAEAFTALPQWKPDLLLCDLGMPEEDGYSLIRRIRAREETNGEGTLPAIALTGYVRVEERVQALMAGFQLFVPKPVEGDELASIIATLVGRGDPDVVKQSNT